MTSTYQQAASRLSDLTAIEEALGILQWDQEIVMPAGAAEARGRQMATLAVLAHQRLTDPQLQNWLAELVDDTSLSTFERANVREANRDLARAVKIPPDLVRAWGESTVRAHEVWVHARRAKDFSAFEKELANLVELAKRRAAAVDPHRPAYDVLIDEFEPGMTMARIDPIFAELKGFLLPLLERVRAAPLPCDVSWLQALVPAEQQRLAGESIVRSMGYDFNRGRLDTSVHPFCGGAGPTDVRITTRYQENAFVGSLMGMIHETGHALYEQGRPAAWADQPVSRARSMGIHESQSLLWEKQVGQNAPFWQHHLARLQTQYPFLQAVSLDQFVFGLNLVDFNNFIRVEADELTYPLHVILRYEIERDLFSGAIEVHDLPEVWNAKMQQYLGITPPDAALGVLQDVHWSGGSFGYFPSYTLGALYAAQFYGKARQEVPGLEQGLAQGDPQPLLGWLRNRIHQHGSVWTTDDLVTQATGEPLNLQHFIAYAGAKYSRLYGLK